MNKIFLTLIFSVLLISVASATSIFIPEPVSSVTVTATVNDTTWLANWTAYNVSWSQGETWNNNWTAYNDSWSQGGTWNANWTAYNTSWSNITNYSYVPYTGATQGVNLGIYDLTVDDIWADIINFTHLRSTHGGTIDAAGDPWTLTGVNFGVVQNITAEFILGRVSWINITELNTTIDSRISINNDSVTNAITDTNGSLTNYIVEVNTSQTHFNIMNNGSIGNYVDANNDSVINYIIEVNATNFQVDTDPFWQANWSAFNETWSNSYNDTQNLSINNWITENNESVNNNIDDKTTTTYYNATQSGIITGTIDGGFLNYTQHPNGDYDGKTLNFSEAAGSPGIDIRINFTNGLTTFTQGVMRYKTSSLAGEYPIIQMWSYSELAWEDYPPVAESLGFATIAQPVFDGEDHVSGGIAQMRIYKATNGNTNNHYYVDWLAIAKGPGVPSPNEVDPLSIHRDGNVTLTGNWDQGSWNLTNVLSWFLGLISWTQIPELNTTIDSLIDINNDSVTNSIADTNGSLTNYIAENNVTIENYIIEVNATNFQVEGDPFWLANWTAYNESWSADSWVANYSLYYTSAEMDIINTTMNNHVAEVNLTMNNTLTSNYVPYTDAQKNINISFNNLSIGGGTIWWNGSFLIIT